MRKLIILISLTVVLLFILGCDDSDGRYVDESQGNKTAFTNGDIYTANDMNPWAETIVIEDDHIVFVGSDDDASQWIDEQTIVIDLEGTMLMPGLHDTHSHPFVMMSTALVTCNLFEGQSKADYLQLIEACLDDQSDRDVVIGMGFNIDNFGGKYPHKRDLDRIIPDKPAVFIDNGGHAAWANSAMLELAGINADTEAEYGKVVKDEYGEPTGFFLEDAMSLVTNLGFELDEEEQKEALKRAVSMMNAKGITSFVEAQVITQDTEDIFVSLDQVGELNARTNLALWVDPTKPDSQIAELIKRKGVKSPFVDVNQAKFLIDGTFEIQTAALLEPYNTDPDNYGMMTFNQDRLNSYATKLEKAGFSLHMHTVGDRGVRSALDAFEYAYSTNGIENVRNVLTHLYLIDDEDIQRFNDLNVIANYQAYWAQPYMYDFAETVGDERIESMFPFKKLHDAGVMITAGSDWPVSTFNPFKAMEVAITRENPEDNFSDDALNESQSLDLETILDAYTINGAYLMHQEDVTGSLEVGKKADLIVLDRNLFETPAEDVGETKVIMTMLDGKVIYEAY